MYSIIKQRNKASSFISMVLQNIQFKIKVKHLLDKLEENYMIISSFSRCESLYFNIIYDNGLTDNLFFDYCDILKCFVYYFSKSENYLNNKILKGNFISDISNYCPIIDVIYPVEIENCNSYNIINIPKIIKRNKEYQEILDEDTKTFLIQHKRKKRNYNRMNSEVGKIYTISRAGSKSILKPSKSYLSLKEKKKISFGSTEFLN